MNLRDHEFSLVAVSLVGLALLLVIGGVVIGYVTVFGDNTPTESDYNTSEPPAVTDSADLPPGYGPTHISWEKARDIHLTQLSDSAYLYEHQKVTRTSDGTTRHAVTMTVAATGEAYGVANTDGPHDETTRRFYSADGVEYVEQTNESVRRFGNSRFATGITVVERVLANASVRAAATGTRANETWVRYDLESVTDSGTMEGTLLVTADGRIKRLTVNTEYANGTYVEESFIITPQENVSVTRPEWASED